MSRQGQRFMVPPPVPVPLGAHWAALVAVAVFVGLRWVVQVARHLVAKPAPVLRAEHE